MKKICLIAAFLLTYSSVFCQNDAKIQQILKLKIYLSWLKKGYDIVNKGLTLISDIKHGDFDLHHDYFNSLELVKPAVQSDAKITAIIAMQKQMLLAYKSYRTKILASGVFTAPEIAYLQQVFAGLLNEAAEDITALTNVVSDGQLQMKDDERIGRINQLYHDMTDKYEFLHDFGDQVQLQALQRQKGLQETQTILKLY